MQNKKQVRKMILCAVFCALIIVMTAIPYTGYITTGPIEITTLHIIVIIGSVMLGWKYGALLGAVWGLSCMVRALTNPMWIMFVNPLISLLPRIAVGIIAGLIYKWLSKTKLGCIGACIAAAVCGTLTNTVLVISAMFIFGNMIKEYSDVFEIFKSIYATVIGLNGIIELSAATVITPIICRPLLSYIKRLND